MLEEFEAHETSGDGYGEPVLQAPLPIRQTIRLVDWRQRHEEAPQDKQDEVEQLGTVFKEKVAKAVYVLCQPEEPKPEKVLVAPERGEGRQALPHHLDRPQLEPVPKKQPCDVTEQVALSRCW